MCLKNILNLTDEHDKKMMNNWKTKNGYEIIQVLSGRSNAYLLLKDKLIVLIDTGKESAFKKLSKAFDLLGLSLDKITHLILTHTHFDHCQSAGKIKENSSCKIIVSEKAEDSIDNGYTKLPGGTTYTNLSLQNIYFCSKIPMNAARHNTK